MVQSPLDAASPKYLVASDRVEFLAAKLGSPPLRTLGTFKGTELAGLAFEQPLAKGAPSPVLTGEHVVTDTGTGIVHTAPGHGLEDYTVCLRAGIEPYCPVDESGCYTKVRSLS